MARREYWDRPQCAHEGCTEVALYTYSTQRDRREAAQRRRKDPWRCTRHTRPDEVLTPENPSREHVLVAALLMRKWDPEVPLGLFWRPEGQETGGRGFVFGPGFKAYASDFPEGTRLIVTARIELPDERAEPTT